MTSDVLQDLVKCERLADRFPYGLSVRACLRRQVDQKIYRDEDGRETARAHRNPICALECQQGAEVLARALEAGVEMVACGQCGTGRLVGVPCSSCEGEPVSKPAVDRSERCWNGEAPDVPLGRPPSELSPGDAAAAAVARVRAAAPVVAPAAVNEAPVEPAKEGVMPCPECKSPTNHKATCSRRPGAKPALPPAPRVKPGTVRVVPAHHRGVVDEEKLRGLDVPSLLTVRRIVEDELRDRLGRAEAELEELRRAVAEAAQRTGEAA